MPLAVHGRQKDIERVHAACALLVIYSINGGQCMAGSGNPYTVPPAIVASEEDDAVVASEEDDAVVDIRKKHVK
jgi:hypothetical protein